MRANNSGTLHLREVNTFFPLFDSDEIVGQERKEKVAKNIFGQIT
jgi:hypothetical protein